jgi:cell division protease FtsH
MVTEYGMSASVGAVKLGGGSGEVFMGRDMGHSRDYSDELAMSIDTEVRLLIDAAHTEAWMVINDNRHVLDRLATELLEKETLDHDQLATIFADVRKLPQRPQWLSSDDRPVSDLPPVEVPQKAVAKKVVAKKVVAKKPPVTKAATTSPVVRKPRVTKPAAEKPTEPNA